MSDRSLVTVTDVQIPFGSLVVLFIKMALAAIPAALILALVLGFLTLVFGGYLALL
jgi:hypothetical protein